MSDLSLSDLSSWATEDLNALIENYSSDGTEAGIDIAAVQAAINDGTLATSINQEDAVAWVAYTTLDLDWMNPDISLTEASLDMLDEARRDTAPYESLAEFHEELVTYLGLTDTNTAIDDAAILIAEAGVDNDSPTTGTTGDSDTVVITNIVQALMMATGGNVFLAMAGLALGTDVEYMITQEDMDAGYITQADGTTIDVTGYEVGGTITFENDSVLETLANAAMDQTEGLTEDSEAIADLMEDYPDAESETFAEEAKAIDVQVSDYQTKSGLRMDIIDTLQKFKDELTQMISQGLDSMAQTDKAIIGNF